MALFIGQYSATLTNEVLVAGVAGKRIRVSRFLASTENNAVLRLLSAPGQPEQRPLLPALYSVLTSTTDVPLRRGAGVSTDAGAALGLTSTIGTGSKVHGVMVWYELVD